ncbi:MAG TPA: GntR family transcriptional regulator [Acidimicrobiales bacterium]|nr:GntR family transcriptional regulator [Acidimicrobiales bacterium]
MPPIRSVALDLEVSRERGPLHSQISAAISSAIADGRLPPGYRLPPERELATLFNVNRLTVRQALAGLQQRRLIQRRTGRHGGTFVMDAVLDYDLTHFAGFTSLVQDRGRVASAVVLSAREDVTDELTAEALKLGPDARVAVVDRLRLADGAPVLVEHSAFPARRFPGLLGLDLTGSLYALMDAHYGARPVRADESVEPVAADTSTAELLGVPRGRPLLAVTRVAYDAAGSPVEYARDVLRGDRARAVTWSVELPADRDRR